MVTLLIVIVVIVVIAVLVMKFLPRMRGQATTRRGQGLSHGDRGGVAGSPDTYDPATPLEDRYPEDNRV